MKIRKLIEKLNKLDLDQEVLISSDPEGNSYSILKEVCEDNLHFSKISYEIEILHENDGKLPESAKKCIILYP